MLRIVLASALSLMVLGYGWSSPAVGQEHHDGAPTAEADASATTDAHKPAAGHDAHAAHIGTEGVGEDPSEFKGDLAIYTFVVFLLLMAILGKFAWGPIASGLDKREHRIADEIAAAERSHQEARNLLAEYERKLASAQDDVRAIMEEARRDAEHTQQEILAKAKADSQAEVARGKREIETATAQALKSLAENSANLAVDLAGRIVRAKLTAADHSALISDAVARFPQSGPSQN